MVWSSETRFFFSFEPLVPIDMPTGWSFSSLYGLFVV
jgi:hypothetical protein